VDAARRDRWRLFDFYKSTICAIEEAVLRADVDSFDRFNEYEFGSWLEWRDEYNRQAESMKVKTIAEGQIIPPQRPRLDNTAEQLIA